MEKKSACTPEKILATPMVTGEWCCSLTSLDQCLLLCSSSSSSSRIKLMQTSIVKRAFVCESDVSFDNYSLVTFAKSVSMNVGMHHRMFLTVLLRRLSGVSEILAPSKNCSDLLTQVEPTRAGNLGVTDLTRNLHWRHLNNTAVHCDLIWVMDTPIYWSTCILMCFIYRRCCFVITHGIEGWITKSVIRRSCCHRYRNQYSIYFVNDADYQ